MKVIGEKGGEDQIEEEERSFASKLVEFQQLKKELKNGELIEKMSRDLVKDKDKITLMQLMIKEQKKVDMTPEPYRKGHLEKIVNASLLKKERTMKRNGSEVQILESRNMLSYDNESEQQDQADLTKLLDTNHNFFEQKFITPRVHLEHRVSNQTKQNNYLKFNTTQGADEESNENISNSSMLFNETSVTRIGGRHKRQLKNKLQSMQIENKHLKSTL